jgi:hypothetical protein
VGKTLLGRHRNQLVNPRTQGCVVSDEPTATPAAMQKVVEQAAEAAKAIDLDEIATRAIIDQQLRDRGWEVDSQTLRYASGARPVKNRSMAIRHSSTPPARGQRNVRRFDEGYLGF